MKRLWTNRSSADVCSVDGTCPRGTIGIRATLPAKGGARHNEGKVYASGWRLGGGQKVDERRTGPSPMRRSSPPDPGGTTWCLLTGRLAVAGRRDERVRRVDADTAREVRQLAVRVRREPGTGIDGDLRHADARRRLELHALRGIRRVGSRVGEVRLFSRDQVAQIRLHGGDVRLRLRVGELRDGDRGKNTDDHDDDQKLDKGETLADVALHLKRSPIREDDGATLRAVGRGDVVHAADQHYGNARAN